MQPEDEGKITILKNWNEEHLEYLKRKFDARGIEMVIKDRSAVIRGRQWASLEQSGKSLFVILKG